MGSLRPHRDTLARRPRAITHGYSTLHACACAMETYGCGHCPGISKPRSWTSSLVVGDMDGDRLKSSDDGVPLMIALASVPGRSLGGVPKIASRVLNEGGEAPMGRRMARGLLAGFGSTGTGCERARSGSPESIEDDDGIISEPSNGSISRRYLGRVGENGLEKTKSRRREVLRQELNHPDPRIVLNRYRNHLIIFSNQRAQNETLS